MSRKCPAVVSRAVVVRTTGIIGLCLTVAACSAPLLPRTASREPVGQVAVDQGEAAGLVSTYRGSRGAGVVIPDPGLQRIAQAQANAMAEANELSHTVAGSLPTRLGVLGRSREASIENVSAGYPSLDAALAGWRRSPHHNENLLYGPMRRIGVAASTAPNTRYKTFWALVMTD